MMSQNQIRSDQDTLVIRSRSFAGTDCGAFINAQANLLERQQARIDNPESTDEDLWVVCPLSMPLGVGGDPESCDDPPAWSRIGGWINVFWNDGATIDGRVDCVVRHYGYHNTHQPGVSLDGVLSVATLSSHFDETQSLPYVDSRAFELPEPQGGWSYVIASCLLSPGAGINSLELEFGSDPGSED